MSKCSGSKKGHKYETVGDKISCTHCPRIVKYDPVSKSWKTIQE